MAPLYQRIRNQTIAANDRVWAERIQLLALDANKRAEPARRKPFTAVLRTNDTKAENLDNHGVDFSADMVATGGELGVDITKAAALDIKVGDKIKALDRPSQPLFEVLRVGDRRHDRIYYYLGDS